MLVTMQAPTNTTGAGKQAHHHQRSAARAGPTRVAATSASTSAPRPRRPPPGVRLRRGDLPVGRPQPWAIEYETSLAGLGVVEESGGSGAAPPPDAATAITAHLSVSITGAGFFVRGRLAAGPDLALACEACGAPVPVSLEDAAFQVWLDPTPPEEENAVARRGLAATGDDADAVPWPPHASSVDLTPAAAGAARAALPRRVSCGAPACSVREWRAGEAGAGAGGPAVAAFGRLAGLRARLKE